MLAFM